jgi:integrase
MMRTNNAVYLAFLTLVGMLGMLYIDLVVLVWCQHMVPVLKEAVAMADKYTSSTLREVRDRDGKRRAWKGVLKYKDNEGKWRQIAKTFSQEVRTKKQAQKALTAWHEEMESEAGRPEEARQTMQQLVSAYVGRREAASKAAGWDTTKRVTNNEKVITRSTVRDYHHTLSFLEKSFPKVELANLKPMDILRWEEEQLVEGHSLSRVRKAHVLCKQALNDAVVRGYIESSCMASLKAPTLGRHDNNALSQADAQKLTAQLSVYDPSAAVVGAMLALHCGLRGGEACALQWRDVDFKTRHITVKKAVGIGDGGKFLKGTKSESGNRVIWMDDYVFDILRGRKAQTLAMRDSISTGFDELFVIGDVDGNYLSPTTLSRSFTAISKALGLRGKTGEVPTLHKMRHTFADALRGNGGDSKAIRDVMGHSSLGVTDKYGTKDQQLMDEAVMGAAKWLSPNAGTKTEADVLTLEKTGTEG